MFARRWPHGMEVNSEVDFGGIDGLNVPELYLFKDKFFEDFDSAKLLDAWKDIGIDCTPESLVFFHADLGPANIIVEKVPSSGKVGTIDFETAGYFPRNWIKMKFRISGRLELTSDIDEHFGRRKACIKAVERNGFQDFMSSWQRWRMSTEHND
jgi:hypothetical protein